MERVVWVARHANREDFKNPDWRKTSTRPDDPDLSEDGVVQAKELAERLLGEKIDHIFCSPFLRTVHTAYFCALLKNMKIKVENGFGEWLNVEWFSSMPSLENRESLMRRFNLIDTDYRSKLTPTFPEAKDEMERRCWKAIRKVLEETEGNLLIVGHGASCESVVIGLTNSAQYINTPLCSLSKVVGNDNRWELVLNGDTSHLSSGTIS
jgi:broad specificity phosphatase PhoE